MDTVFGFPSLVRFSWATCKIILDASAVPVQWCVHHFAGVLPSSCLALPMVHCFRVHGFAESAICVLLQGVR